MTDPRQIDEQAVSRSAGPPTDPGALADLSSIVTPLGPIADASSSGTEALNSQIERSELRYRALFESIDESFCIIEKIGDKPGEPLDFRCIEANPAFAVHTGIDGVVGKTLRQVIPNECEEWLETYETVCKTGQPIRFKRGLIAQGRVLELHVFPIEDREHCRVGVSFKDITEQMCDEVMLRNNRDTFFSLIENAPFGLYIVDAQFRLRQVSAASQKVFSHVRPLIGRDFDDVLRQVWTEPFVSEALGHFRHTLETGEPYAAPNTTQQRNDTVEIESYDWKIERIVLPDGQFGVACYFHDVTERQRTQDILRESEERYRSLFNSIDEGFCIIEMIFDEREQPVDYRFIEVNPTFQKQIGLFGAVGKRVRELVPDIEEFWIETYGKVVLTGEPIRLKHEVKSLDVLLDVYACRVGGPGSRKVAVVFNSIAEREKAAEALRLSEQRFRALFDRGPLAMYSVDASGMIQEFNHNAAVLWGREPMRNDPGERYCGSYKAYFPDGRPIGHAQTAVAAVLKGEIPAAHDVEGIIERPDGSRATVLANIVPILNAAGKITGAMNCLYDITERSLLERKSLDQAEALIDLHRRKDEFLAMLSHELRNPLAPLSNAVYLLGLQKDEDPIQRQARKVIERQVGQLKHLIDDLLEVTRITTGKIQLREERIVIAGVVERAIEAVQPVIAQRRHELTVTLPDDPIWLIGDASRLEQVIVNLLTNAAKYTDEGGRITVSVSQENGLAVLRVHDTGVGIAPELLPRIFDLFTQAKRSLDRSQGGLGIGLCLVQQLVDLHGGAVDVTSVLGQGSEFTVFLPIASAAIPAIVLDPEAVSPAGEHCRVLVVDDNHDGADILAMLVQEAGHQVQVAYDGPGALESASAFLPDLVLLDIGLPGLDGYEVAKRIRLQPALSDVVLVALTGYGHDTDRLLSQDAGFDHHLVKPTNFDRVKEILASLPKHCGRLTR